MNNNCGVYAIVNKVNGKIYIGSSANLDRRKKEHFKLLIQQKHRNYHIQQAFNKYGEGNFEFKILKFCKEDKLTKTEQHYINYYQSCNPNCGYNLSVRADRGIMSPEGRKKVSESMKNNKIWLGRSHTEETKKKLSEIAKKTKRKPSAETSRLAYLVNTGRKQSPEEIEKRRLSLIGKKHSEEARKNMGRKYLPENERKKISERMKGNKYGLNRKITEATREKMRLAQLGQKHSPERVEKNRQRNLGKKLSEEHKEKLSKAGLGRKQSSEAKEKVRQARLGKHLSDETKEKLRQKAILQWAIKKQLQSSLLIGLG